jgi:type 1 glutamine amidotransferase
MRRAVSLLALVAVLTCVFCVAASAADAPAKIRVLLITGDDVGAHKWQETTPPTREALEKTGKFYVRVCEDPLILESENALKQYDVVAFMMYNKSVPMISDQAQQNLLNFVKGGKGFYVQHMASASFADWEEFGKLCGRKWVMKVSGHGARTPFEVKIVKKDHPITKGIDNFQVDDELYAKLQGSGPINVLAEAYSDWSKQTEPLVFTLDYGKGRTAYSTFGHDGKAVSDPNVSKIIARSVEWAATGKVEGN